MYDLIFSTPWWLLILICGIGVVVFITGNNRQENKLRNAGVGIFFLGIILTAVGYLVETDKDKVKRHTRELVSAIVHSNWPVVESMLDPQITFARLHGSSEIMHSLELAQQTVHVTNAHIANTRVDQSPGVISEDIEVYTVQDATLDRPILSTWRLDWEPTPDDKDWRLTKVVCVGAGQIKADEIEAHIPGAR